MPEPVQLIRLGTDGSADYEKPPVSIPLFVWTNFLQILPQMMQEDRPINSKTEKVVVKEGENSEQHSGNSDDCATSSNTEVDASVESEKNHLADNSQTVSTNGQDSPNKRKAKVIGSRIAKIADERFKRAKKSDEKKSTNNNNSTGEDSGEEEEDITDQVTPPSTPTSV